MYKLFVVDDDEIICNGIASLKWEEYGVTVSGSAYDGETAMELVTQDVPDIIIVDINMPFMDGIELTFNLRQKYPHLKVIMLTAFKEFSYAQKAVELQVSCYLTKPFKTAELIQAVKRVVEELEKEEKFQREAIKNIHILKNNYLSELVSAGVTEDNREILHQILGPSCQDDFFCCAVLYLKTIEPCQDTSTRLFQEEASVRISVETIEQLLNGRKGVQFFPLHSKVVFLFQSDEQTELETKATEVLQKVMEELAKNDRYFLSCGMGNPCQGIETVRFSYSQAKRAVEHCFEFGHMSIIHVADISAVDEKPPVDEAAYKQVLKEAVQKNDLKTLAAAVEDLFQELRQSRTSNLSSVQFLALELAITVYQAIGESKLYEKFWHRCQESFPQLMKTNSIDSIYTWLKGQLEDAYRLFREKDITPPERLVNAAVNYINQHYSDPELSLKGAAEEVHISSSYLSALFRQYAGTSFVGYLSKVRMTNAIRLIADPNVKTYEIAYKVGFNSSQYFSASFKKYTGMTPGEYRADILRARQRSENEKF